MKYDKAQEYSHKLMPIFTDSFLLFPPLFSHFLFFPLLPSALLPSFHSLLLPFPLCPFFLFLSFLDNMFSLCFCDPLLFLVPIHLLLLSFLSWFLFNRDYSRKGLSMLPIDFCTLHFNHFIPLYNFSC